MKKKKERENAKMKQYQEPRESCLKKSLISVDAWFINDETSRS